MHSTAEYSSEGVAAEAQGRLQVEAQLAEARAATLGLQDSEARRSGSLVFRLIRGGLSILAAALALQQVWALLLLPHAPPACMPSLHCSRTLWPVAPRQLHGKKQAVEQYTW